MAQVTISQLPQAQPLTGTETVPINQNGLTVQTTVADIANSPTQQQSFITANAEPTLPNYRQLSGSTGVGLVDGGSQGQMQITLNGVSGSLETSTDGLIAKSGGSVVGRSITGSSTGVAVTNGDGVAGNPVVALTGAVGTINGLAGTGIMALQSGSTVGAVNIVGTTDEITVANGDGQSNPTIGIADNPVIPGVSGMVAPVGNTADRGIGVNGKFRYNSQTDKFEGYQNSQWKNFGYGDGTVTSVDVSGGTTGLTTSGGPITTSGTITFAGTLVAANGGTGIASYTAGDLLYASGSTTLSKLGIGANTFIMTSNGSAPGWTNPASVSVGYATAAGSATTATTATQVSNSISFNSSGGASPGTNFNGSVARTIDYSTVGAPKADGTGASGTWGINISGNAATATSATSATTATNLAGGAANRIPYQSGAGATTFAVAPTNPDTFLKWNGMAFEWGAVAGAGTVTSVGLALPSEFTVTNSPVTSSGTLTGTWASQTANYVFAAPDGVAGTPTFRALTADDVPTAGAVANSVSFDNSGAGGSSPQSFDGSAAVTVSYNTIGAANSGTNTNITSIDSITGGISTPDFINFDNSLVAAPTTVEGGLYYNNDDNTASLEFVGNNGQLLKVNEEQYYRVKASGSITKGQVVMFTGTVGASGGLTAAPATGLTANQANYLLGIATENISSGNWGYVTFFGEVKKIDTTGGAEAWVNGTVLYYNPAVTGGLTKNKPTVPNAIAVMAAVVYADATNGILFIRPTYGSVLGGTDGNVSFGTLSGGDVIVYDSGNQYWKNAAQSTLSVSKATNIAGGTGGSVPYQSAADTTTFLAIGSSTYLLTSTGTAPQWSNPSGVTVGTATTAGKVANSVTFNSSGGATPNTSFDGSAARTIDYSTVGAPKADGTGASGTWGISISGNAATATSATTATNIASGAQGSIPYQTAAGTTAFLAKDTNATRYLANTGTTNNPAWSQIDLSNGVTGTLPIANGGTNATATPTAGTIAYGTGTSYAFTAAGTSGQVLTSAAAGTPTWTTATNLNTASAIVQRDASGNFTAGTITATLSGNASTATTATNATNVAVTADATNATRYLGFYSATTGNLGTLVDADITYNPSTNTFTTGTVVATAGISGGTF